MGSHPQSGTRSAPFPTDRLWELDWGAGPRVQRGPRELVGLSRGSGHGSPGSGKQRPGHGLIFPVLGAPAVIVRSIPGEAREKIQNKYSVLLIKFGRVVTGILK